MSIIQISTLVMTIIALIELIVGVVKKSGLMIIVGIVFVIAGALSAYLAFAYEGALYLTGPGYML